MSTVCNCCTGIIPGEWREVGLDTNGYYHLCPYHGKTYLRSYFYNKEEPLKSAFDVQEGGSHYKDFSIQPVEFITKNELSWFVGSIVKYACRHKAKGGALDMKKVIHYARLCLEQDYGIKSKIEYDQEEEARKTTTS